MKRAHQVVSTQVNRVCNCSHQQGGGMKEALEQLWLSIDRHHKSLASLLQPGLTRDEIDRLMADLPYTLGEDVYDLYMWRNGTLNDNSALGASAFIPGTVYYFMPLEEAVEHLNSVVTPYRKAFDQLGAFGETIPFDLRNTDYLPILFDGIIGEFLVPVYQEQTCKSIVIEYVRDVKPPKIAFSSILAMIQEITKAIDNPEYTVLKRH